MAAKRRAASCGERTGTAQASVPRIKLARRQQDSPAQTLTLEYARPIIPRLSSEPGLQVISQLRPELAPRLRVRCGCPAIFGREPTRKGLGEPPHEFGIELGLQAAYAHVSAVLAYIDVVERRSTVKHVMSALRGEHGRCGSEGLVKQGERADVSRAGDHVGLYDLPAAGDHVGLYDLPAAGAEGKDDAEGAEKAASRKVGEEVEWEGGFALAGEHVEHTAESEIVDVMAYGKKVR